MAETEHRFRELWRWTFCALVNTMTVVIPAVHEMSGFVLEGRQLVKEGPGGDTGKGRVGD